MTPLSAGERSLTLGIISDTHGLLRPEAVEALRGSRLILHAGDIGSRHVLTGLGEIAPVVAVRGNVDRAAWADAVPERRQLCVEGLRLHLLHNIRDLDAACGASGWDVIVFGHSHRPGMAWQGKTLHFNPGSAGPRRFRLPVTVGRLFLAAGSVQGEIVDLPMRT